MKILTIDYDESPENPCDFDSQWKLYSFNRKHHGYKSPDAFFPDGKPSIGLRRKLAVGTAFILDYFEHGSCVWSLGGEGPSCRWDTSEGAGILVWEHPVGDMGAKTREARAKDAAAFLETYTCWCNGEVYGYSVQNVKTLECGHTENELIDSCWGFYGNDLDHMSEEIRAAIDGDPEVQFKGRAKGLSGYHDFISPLPKKETDLQEDKNG